MVGRLYGSLKKIVSRLGTNFFVQLNLNTTRFAPIIIKSLSSKSIKEYGCNYSVNANKPLLTEFSWGIMSFNSETPVPQVKGADLENNKLDSFRSVVASVIADFSGKSADDILGLLEVPKNSEHGDIAIAIPKLRVQGKPVQIAQQWVEKVHTIDYILLLILLILN